MNNKITTLIKNIVSLKETLSEQELESLITNACEQSYLIGKLDGIDWSENVFNTSLDKQSSFLKEQTGLALEVL